MKRDPYTLELLGVSGQLWLAACCPAAWFDFGGVDLSGKARPVNLPSKCLFHECSDANAIVQKSPNFRGIDHSWKRHFRPTLCL
jgi:hypothetical protein